MNLLSAEGISKKYGEKVLFNNLNIGLNQGDRIGLVGVNGAGKSTLLKLLTGNLLPDTGTVSIRKGLKVGYLGQIPDLDDQSTVFDIVFFSDDTVLNCIATYERCLHAVSLGEQRDTELQFLTDEMNRLDAWTLSQKVQEIIHRMGIGAFLYKPIAQLSGGQKKRTALAKTLLFKPDLLILDEPTNHLDIETIEWLQNILDKEYTSILLITHDRYFLDAVCNQIWELNHGSIYKYKGDYAYYIEKKYERESIAQAEFEKNKNRYRKELEWIRKQPKARGTKAKYREDAFDELKQKISGKQQQSTVELSIKMDRQGGKIGELRKLSKKFGSQVLIENFSYTFKKLDRIGIVGKNGAGKTTLLNILTGNENPDKGEIIWGNTTKIGYYKQSEVPFPEDMRLIECIKSMAEVITLADGSTVSASQFLTKFLFPPQDQYKHVKLLSGGERKRLQLMQVLLHNPNFLILDEPTNDLDLGTLHILEEFLETYTGTLVLVSHDRYFMDNLVDHLWVLDGSGVIQDFPGNYTDYRAYQDNQKTAQTIATKQVEKHNESNLNVAVNQKRKLSYKEQKELQQIEAEIEKLESEIKQLSDAMNQSSSFEVLQKNGKLLEQATQLLEEKTIRWMELQEN